MLTLSNLRKIYSGQIWIENVVIFVQKRPNTIINQLSKKMLIQRAHGVINTTNLIR